MQFLNERECGYDAERIGFPSISGCLAVLYLTQNRLYGFHNNGGNNSDTLIKERGRLFAGYVGKNDPNARGVHLYGASFLGSDDNRRGYAGNPLDGLKSELKHFAKILSFSGPISGINLSQLKTTHSAYVEYRRVGQTCLVLGKPWQDATSGKVTVPNPLNTDHRAVRGNDYANVITSIDVSGLVTCDITKLK